MSRSRPQMFDSLCRSIANTCTLDYEIHVGLDSDDPTLIEYNDIISNNTKCKAYIETRHSNLHVRLNSMLETISGRYIFGLNDDCLLTHNGWDKEAVDLLDDAGDIVYGRTYDNSIDRINNQYAAFPIVSKVAAKKLGFIIDDSYGNHGADVITYRIYQGAGKVVDLKCVQIDHLFHNSVISLEHRMSDQTAVEMIQRTMQGGFNINNLFTIDLSDKINKLI